MRIVLKFVICTSLWGIFFFQTPLYSMAENRPATPGTSEGTATLIDSLSAAADSLARTVDSLKILVDSLIPLKTIKSPPKVKKVEKKPEPEEKNPWDGSFGLGLTVNRGNSRQRTLVSTIKINRKGIKTAFYNSAAVTNTHNSEGRNTDKGTFKSKFELSQSKRFFYFASLDMDYNRQAGINLRLAPGIGVGIKAIARKYCQVNLNLGANPITEYLKDRPNRTRGHYLASQDMHLVLNGRASLDQSITFKPRFDKTEDYLFTFNVMLTSNLTSNFDLKVNLENTYTSRPPLRNPPIRRQDWMFYTAISYSIW